ncbi:MAG TPA: hypothetical protein VJ969_02380 [Desulfopila sp.]|nr:hypothetical protein [Desulfopila sp.]
MPAFLLNNSHRRYHHIRRAKERTSHLFHDNHITHPRFLLCIVHLVYLAGFKNRLNTILFWLWFAPSKDMACRIILNNTSRKKYPHQGTIQPPPASSGCIPSHPSRFLPYGLLSSFLSFFYRRFTVATVGRFPLPSPLLIDITSYFKKDLTGTELAQQQGTIMVLK